MKKILKILIPQTILDFLLPYRKQWVNFKTLAFKYNQLASMKKWSCIDSSNNPIPWYTYPAIEYLSNLDFSEKTILEWGGGNSSLFWAKRCKKLITIESNPEWIKVIKENKMPNQEIYFKETIKTSTNTINEFACFPLSLNEEFDIMIIDGEDLRRDLCAKTAIEIIEKQNNKNVMIVFDNSDWYPNTCKILRDSDLIQIDFHGFAPINAYTHTTSIFLARSFSFDAIHEIQPNYSISAVHHRND